MWLSGIIDKDVSKTRDLEARLERAEQELRLFQRVSRLMTRDMELDEVLQEIVSLVRAFLNCDSCLIYLKEDEELSSSPRAISTPNTSAACGCG